jgi:hypothetical protein
MWKRSKRGVGGSLGLWLGSKEQKLFAILDHEGHEIETWRWGEDDAWALPSLRHEMLFREARHRGSAFLAGAQNNRKNASQPSWVTPEAWRAKREPPVHPWRAL